MSKSEMVSAPVGLVAFAFAVIHEFCQERGTALDGGWLQEQALKFGVIQPVPVTEPCGENCICAEVDDFPMDCLRIAPEIDALMAEAGQSPLDNPPAGA